MRCDRRDGAIGQIGRDRLHDAAVTHSGRISLQRRLQKGRGLTVQHRHQPAARRAIRIAMAGGAAGDD